MKDSSASTNELHLRTLQTTMDALYKNLLVTSYADQNISSQQNLMGSIQNRAHDGMTHNQVS